MSAYQDKCNIHGKIKLSPSKTPLGIIITISVRNVIISLLLLLSPYMVPRTIFVRTSLIIKGIPYTASEP